MDAQQTLMTAEALLQPFTVGAASHAPGRVDAVVHREHLVAAVKALVDAKWGYLAAITGLDHPWPKTPAKPAGAATPGLPAKAAEATTVGLPAKAAEATTAGLPAKAAEATTAGPVEDRLEALYHFVNGAAVATLRVSVPYHDTRIPSICPLVPSATLYERELQEMFGFVVDGTPDPGRLLLPDDWPDGVYPLRKAFAPSAPQA